MDRETVPPTVLKNPPLTQLREISEIKKQLDQLTETLAKNKFSPTVTESLSKKFEKIKTLLKEARSESDDHLKSLLLSLNSGLSSLNISYEELDKMYNELKNSEDTQSSWDFVNSLKIYTKEVHYLLYNANVIIFKVLTEFKTTHPPSTVSEEEIQF